MMETILFVLFLVGVQVVDSLVKAKKKRQEYEEQVKRTEEQRRTAPPWAEQRQSPPVSSEKSWREEEYEDEEEYEEELEETFAPQAASPQAMPPLSQPNPSPIPEGLQQLQEIFRQLQERESEAKKQKERLERATHSLPQPPLQKERSKSIFEHEGGESLSRRTSPIAPPVAPLAIASGIGSFKFDAAHLRDAVLYAEILGKPKAMSRQIQRR